MHLFGANDNRCFFDCENEVARAEQKNQTLSEGEEADWVKFLYFYLLSFHEHIEQRTAEKRNLKKAWYMLANGKNQIRPQVFILRNDCKLILREPVAFLEN